MQLKKWLFGLTLVFLSTNLKACPTSWDVLKKTLQGPFYTKNGYQFNVKREIQYKCNFKGEIEFRTIRLVFSPYILNGDFLKKLSPNCTKSCNKKNVTVTVILWKLSKLNEWNLWSTSFPYVEKNCDKAYWSSWTKTVNCSISTQQRYTRKCVDCDGENFDFEIKCSGKTTKIEQCHPSWSTWVTKNYSINNCNLTEKITKTWDCFFEDKSKAIRANLCLKVSKKLIVLCKSKCGNLEVLCRPSWSMWMTGTCFGVNCNSTGERVRIRNCLYGNGSKSSSIKLCSNQSNIKTEQCITNFSNCSYVKSRLNAKESNFLSNVGIIVTLCGISIVIIVIVVFLIKSKKSKEQCIKFKFLNTSQDKSNNQSLSVNEIYNSKPINNIGLTNNSKPSELNSVATYVNQTFSLDGFKTVQKKNPENAYEMAQENWDETHKDMNNIYTHLKNSDQSHKDKDSTYDHLENYNA